MLSDRILQEMIAFKPSAPVLSVYLDVDPLSGAAETARLRLRQMVKDFEPHAPQDVERVQRYIDHEYDGSGRSLALFSCAEADFFHDFTFALPLRSRARLLETPYVKPLADLLENYGHFGVAIVDSQGARLFHFHLGELITQEGTAGESVRASKHGAGSSAPGRRSTAADPSRASDETIERNLRQSAQFAAEFFTDHQIRRVLVGGTEPIPQRFIDLLPKRWQSLTLGTFPIEMTAGHVQVLEKAMTLARSAEQMKDQHLMEAIITASAKGSGGVIRLEDTLAAVHSGNVQVLVIRDGYRAPGHRCKNCGYLSMRSLPSCPFCGGDFEYIEDAVEFAIQRVIQDGGEVQVVHNNPLLDQMGSIGALLRY
jgi:peptide chain release factor subunit 1